MITGKEFMAILACYALGCFTAGYYWTRWRLGQDIRTLGSRNAGARNVGRVLGPWGFVVTLLLDAAKGALAVGIARFIEASPDATVACVVAVVAGHNWPVQLRFQGGKGVAASLGALLAYDPFIALVLVVVFLPVYALLRNFTLSGMLAYALSPLLVFLSRLGNVKVATVSFLAVLVVYAHRKNIREEIARMHSARTAKNRRRPRDKGAAS